MEQKFTPEQLNQVITEVEELTNRHNRELSREQVEEILSEINLPVEFLDEAMVQIRHREILKQQQTRRWFLTLGIAVALMGILTMTLVLRHQREQNLGQISTLQSRITLSEDNGETLTTLDRENSPLLYYQVTLQEVPHGSPLDLRCDWINPDHTIVHQNRYQTRQIDKTVWNTHCRYQLGRASPPGTWTVQMYLEDRLLSQTTFTVE